MVLKVDHVAKIVPLAYRAGHRSEDGIPELDEGH